MWCTLMGRHICTICANVYIFGNHIRDKLNMQLVKNTYMYMTSTGRAVVCEVGAV